MAVYKTREVQFDDEVTFIGRTYTYSYHMPALDMRWVPKQVRGVDRSLQPRIAQVRPGYLEPKSGDSLEIDVPWHGANVDTSTGALAATGLHKLLADGLGGGSVAQVGGLMTGSPTVTSLPFSGGTLLRGGIIRVGSKLDGRGDGQAAVVGSAITTPASLLTALPGAPSAGDKLRASLMQYFSETMGATKRFLHGFAATGAQYHALGCQMEGITLKTPLQKLPMATLKYRVADWVRSAVTIPSASPAMDDCKAMVHAGGSLFFQTRGTTTRATVPAGEIEITINLGLAEKPTLDAAASYVGVGGYERSEMEVMWKFARPWSSDLDASFAADGSDSTMYQVLWNVGADDSGRCVSAYSPSCFLVGASPTYRGLDKLLYQDVTLQAQEGTDTTNDLTRSIIRLAAS